MSNQDDLPPSGKRGGPGGRRRRREGAEGAPQGPRGERRNKRRARAGEAPDQPLSETGAAAAAGAKPKRRRQGAGDGAPAEGRRRKAGAPVDAETREKRAAARAERAAKRAAQGRASPAAAPAPLTDVGAERGTGTEAGAGEAQRGTRNPYITFRRADGPSIEVDAALSDRLLDHAIDVADAHFRTHLVAAGAVTKAEREAIAKTLAFTRSNAPSPTFREDQFVAGAVLLALLQPKLVAAVGANADVLAAAFGASKAKVVASGTKVDALSRALGRDAFVETDFAAHEFGALPDGSLVHLGDDVPTARRLLQAEAKGFDAAIVTASAGLSGVVRQAIPPVPTLPMVLAADHYAVGDVIAWSLRRRRFEATVTEAMLDEMRRARAIVDRVVPFPDLAEHIAVPLTDKRLGPASLVLFR